MFKSSREVILRTDKFSKAIEFYGKTLSLPITYKNSKIVGFETGSFCLYVEKGNEHPPVFEFIVKDLKREKAKLLEAGCIVIEENPKIPRCYIKDPYGFVFNMHEG